MKYLKEKGYEKGDKVPCEIEVDARSYADTYLNFENLVIVLIMVNQLFFIS